MSEGAAWNEKIVEMARAFHDEYEVQAKRFGWQSQTPVPFDELPESNKQTMLNVIAQVVPWNVMTELADLRAQLAQRDEELTVLRAAAKRVTMMWRWTDADRWDSDEWDESHDSLAALSDNQEGRDV